MQNFTVYPAIDLRQGQVVRLKEGDPTRQTTYSSAPDFTASQWVAQGAQWLHVVNLDGAFEESESANLAALRQILSVTQAAQVPVQFGGGLRTMADIARVLEAGVARAILGTVAVTDPDLVTEALARWGAERVVVGIDARDGIVRIRGWAESSQKDAVQLGQELFAQGIRTVIFTDIARDGLGSGINLASTQALQAQTGLSVIASGGVHNAQDVQAVRSAGLAGVIVGRALYEGTLQLAEVL